MTWVDEEAASAAGGSEPPGEDVATPPVAGRFMRGEDPVFTDERGPQEARERYSADSDPAIEPIMKYFKWDHLPQKLQGVSQPFAALAEHILRAAPRSAERTIALRKLLESKDAAVRAAL